MISIAYLLLSVGFGLFCLRFFQGYLKIKSAGSKNSFGMYLAFFFFLLALGTGFLATLYLRHALNSFSFLVIGGITLLFLGGAATTGILLVTYMLPHLGRATKIFMLILVLLTVGWLKTTVLLGSFSLLVVTERMSFMFFTISFASLALIIFQFLLLTKSSEVRIKSVALLVFIGTLCSGNFIALVITPMFQIPIAVPSVLIGLLGVLSVGAVILPIIQSATQSWFQPQNKTKVSLPMRDFLNAF